MAAFVSFGVLPVQIIGVGFLVASAVFFLFELKHPGLGVPTVGGIITLVLGGLLLFNPSVPNARVSPWVIIPVAGVLGAFFVAVVPVAVRARHLPAPAPRERMVGSEGVVSKDLDPEGVVQVASESWTASSAHGTIAKGTPVRVVGMEGLRLKVEPAATESGQHEKGRQA
jgi:membrane-bound serine protease (ClpP class)